MIRFYISCIFLAIFGHFSYAQTDILKSAQLLQELQDSIYDTHVDSIHESIDNNLDNILDSTHLELGIDISSKSVYIGRVYGSHGLFYNPNLLAFYHKSGLGFSISSNIWQKASIDSTITDLNLNYQHTIANWWSFEIDYIYWIFHHDFPSSLDWNNLIDYSNTFKIKDWLNATTDIVFMFGSDRGLAFQEYISHSFYLYPSTKNKRFTIEPEVGAYFGNPNIYTRRNIETSNPNLRNKTFDMLDYYASLHAVYQIPNWSFGFSYEIDLPQLTINTDYKNHSISFVTLSLKRYIGL